MKEVWPFLDECSGCQVQENLYYGFGDSGYIAGSFAGYISREHAIYDIKKQGDGDYWFDIGTKPTDLGSCAVTVLSGREYVDRIKEIHLNDSDVENPLELYGQWSEE